jgi:hypothetical protein
MMGHLQENGVTIDLSKGITDRLMKGVSAHSPYTHFYMPVVNLSREYVPWLPHNPANAVRSSFLDGLP